MTFLVIFIELHQKSVGIRRGFKGDPRGVLSPFLFRVTIDTVEETILVNTSESKKDFPKDIVKNVATIRTPLKKVEDIQMFSEIKWKKKFQ